MPPRARKPSVRKVSITSDDCHDLWRVTIKDGLSQTMFDRAVWFLDTKLVAGFVPEGRSPNDQGERVLAARECLKAIARASRADPKPWLARLGVLRGHGVHNADDKAREAAAMRLLDVRDRRNFRYKTQRRWHREVAVVLLAELRGAGD